MSRTHLTVSRECWYYVFMLGFIVAGAVIRDINLLYIMAGMMLGPLLLSLYVAPKMLRRVAFQRHFPPLISVGDPLVVEIAATKPKGAPRGFAIAVQDRITREGLGRRNANSSAELFFSHVVPGEIATTSYRVHVGRRGRYRIGPLKASSGAPIGMIRALAVHKNKDYVLVSPQLGRLQPEWSRRLQSRHDGGQRSKRRVGHAEGDFYGIREWRNGDSRNWIHWRTTAKRNKLSVRQFEQRVNQDLVLILDLWQPHPTAEPSLAIENAISFAATMIVDHGRHGSSHLMVAIAGDQNLLLRGTASPVFRQELLQRLAIIEPSKTDSLPKFVAECLPQISGVAKIVVVSTRRVDFSDAERFDRLQSDPRLQRLIADSICVDVTSAEFSAWFAIDRSIGDVEAMTHATPRDRQTPGTDHVAHPPESSSP